MNTRANMAAPTQLRPPQAPVPFGAKHAMPALNRGSDRAGILPNPSSTSVSSAAAAAAAKPPGGLLVNPAPSSSAGKNQPAAATSISSNLQETTVRSRNVVDSQHRNSAVSAPATERIGKDHTTLLLPLPPSLIGTSNSLPLQLTDDGWCVFDYRLPPLSKQRGWLAPRSAPTTPSEKRALFTSRLFLLLTVHWAFVSAAWMIARAAAPSSELLVVMALFSLFFILGSLALLKTLRRAEPLNHLTIAIFHFFAAIYFVLLARLFSIQFVAQVLFYYGVSVVGLLLFSLCQLWCLCCSSGGGDSDSSSLRPQTTKKTRRRSNVFLKGALFLLTLWMGASWLSYVAISRGNCTYFTASLASERGEPSTFVAGDDRGLHDVFSNASFILAHLASLAPSLFVLYFANYPCYVYTAYDYAVAFIDCSTLFALFRMASGRGIATPLGSEAERGIRSAEAAENFERRKWARKSAACARFMALLVITLFGAALLTEFALKRFLHDHNKKEHIL